MDNTIMHAEEMEQTQLAEYMLDMFHRMMVHHTLWFREVEHQLGFKRALEAMDYAWSRSSDITLKRMSKEFGFEYSDGVPTALLKMPKEKLIAIIDSIAKNWLAQDGVWFQAVEFTNGMNDAKRCNDSTWSRFSPFEAWSIKRLLGMDEHPGLKGLEKALNFRMYGRLNVQSCQWEGENCMIFQMNDCRVQSARVRKGMDDYPCKSAGLVEYGTFAESIDSRIKTECLGCPPDPHPEEWFCAWKFTIDEE